MLEAAGKIESFCSEISYEDFLKDDILQSAVLHQFMIIGEAIIHIDDRLFLKYNYPWHLPRSFRNYIAHEYFGINFTLVWNTVKKDIPELKNMIEKILADLNRQ